MLYIKVLLALAQRALAQIGYEEVQPDFTHRNQPQVVDGRRQLIVQRLQVGIQRLFDAQRVDTQGITVALRVGQRSHLSEISDLHRWQNTVRHPGGSGARTHGHTISGEIRCVKVTMGIDPYRHTGKTLSVKALF